MKKTFATILTLIGFLSFGQEYKLDLCENRLNFIEPTELDSLYVRALNSRLDLILGSRLNYVEMSDYGKRISELNVSDRFKFLTDKELSDLSTNKKKTINIIRLNHKIIAKDTIDIVFEHVSVTSKRGIFFQRGILFKKTTYLINCGGTKGYQPDIRFVFDRKENKWNLIYNRFASTNE